MGIEIERKFLVYPGREDFQAAIAAAKSEEMKQGYLVDEDSRTLRIRYSEFDGYELTYKGSSTSDGLCRTEIEDIVSEEIGEAMFTLCTPAVLLKTRHYIHLDGLIWEIDEFHNVDGVYWLAEVEIPTIDTEVTILLWVKEEATGNAAYYNSQLIKKVF